jgi:hypothetical protein
MNINVMRLMNQNYYDCKTTIGMTINEMRLMNQSIYIILLL